MKRLLSALLILALLLPAAVLPAAAAPAGGANYTTKQVTAYLFNMNDKKEMTCLFYGDLPTVPYVSATDYLDELYTVTFKSRKNSDGTFTISNVNGEMVIDVEKDTIYFEDYETFVESDPRPALEDETADYLKGDAEYEPVGEEKDITLDLGAYELDLTAVGEEVYFPLPVINDLFAGTYHAAAYLDGVLYFADLMEDEPYYDTASLYESVIRDEKLIDYTYRELCFAMDHFYGCPSKSKLARLIEEKGFDQAIETYNVTTAEAKRLLHSDSLVDYCYGLLYLDMYLDDGGHTVMSYGLQLGMEQYAASAFSKAFTDSAYSSEDNKLMTIRQYLMDQMNYMNDMDHLSDLRDEWFSELTEVKTWDSAAFYQSGDTGVFTFDEFEDAVVKPFKWSMDYAAEHGIENFIIDLSLNGGGSVAAVIYILSVVCGSSRIDTINTLTGNQYSVTETVDRNLDGEFDAADDEVAYDFRVGVLTSQFSFSAANLLPCLLQYNGIAIVGENSGGGTCAIAVHSDPAGYAYAVSDITKLIYPDGTDVDQGAAPDVKLSGKYNDYKGFYDIAQMSEGIAAFYEEHPRPEKPADPSDAPEATETTPADDSESAPHGGDGTYRNILTYLFLFSVGVASVCVISFVVILIRSSRKKKKLW